MHFLGIDVGTTHIKTCLLDERLSLVRTELAAHPMCERPDIGLCYDPDDLWQLVLSQVRTLIEGIDPKSVRAIGVTSMAEAGLPVDASGRALYPIVPWNDMRSKAYGQILLDRFGAYELFRRTGIIYHPKYSISRLIQLRLEKPDIFARMHCWLSVTDLVLNRLCGSFVMDESQACRTMLYNLQDRCWDPELVDASDMAGKLPRVIPMGGIAGTLRTELAAELGLDPDVAIVSGGQDHLCAAVAVGDDQPGTVVNSMGTSEVYFGISDAPKLDRQTFAACVNQGCFTNGRYYWIANIPGSGASIEWMRHILSVQGDIGYSLFSQADALRDPSPLLYFPYVNGSGSPHTDPDRKGLFYGLTAATDVSNMIKSIFEGIAFEARWIMDALSRLGIPIGRILSVGGGTRNLPLMQTKSDILGLDLTITTLKEATGIGAAMQAALACGAVTDLTSQRADARSHESLVRPDHAHSEHYKRRYREYRRLYQSITSFMLSELSDAEPVNEPRPDQ